MSNTSPDFDASDASVGQLDQLNRHAEVHRADDDRSELIEGVPSILMRGTLYTFIAVILISLGISIVAKVNVVVPAKGKIVPEGRNVTVEAQAPGVIIKVHTNPGDRIQRGAPILTLQRAEAGLGRNAIRDKLNLQTKQLAQLKISAKLVAQVLKQPDLIVNQKHSDFIKAGPGLGQINELRSQYRLLEDAKQDLKKFINSQKKLSENEIRVTRQTLNSHVNNLNVLKKTMLSRERTFSRKKTDLERIESLAEKRIVTQRDVSEALEGVIDAEGKIDDRLKEIRQSELDISKTRLRIATLTSQLTKKEDSLNEAVTKADRSIEQAIASLSSTLNRINNSINTLNAAVANLSGQLSLSENKMDQLNIKSPVDGTVTKLPVATIGRNIRQGNPVATIIPDDARPIVEARVKNKDIAFVKEGIPVRIKVDAYPFRQFGTVPATVQRVFPNPDASEFSVRIRLEKSTIKVRGRDVTLKPGLSVTADLLTSKRRLISLVLKKMN